MTTTAVSATRKSSPEPALASKGAVRRRALDALTVVLDVARAGDKPARVIRGFRSRDLFLLLEDGSQVAVSIRGDYSEVVVKHAKGRERAGEGFTQPVGLSLDRISVTRAESSNDVATKVLYRINERQRQKAGVTPDLPYVALGGF